MCHRCPIFKTLIKTLREIFNRHGVSEINNSSWIPIWDLMNIILSTPIHVIRRKNSPLMNMFISLVTNLNHGENHIPLIMRSLIWLCSSCFPFLPLLRGVFGSAPLELYYDLFSKEYLFFPWGICIPHNHQELLSILAIKIVKTVAFNTQTYLGRLCLACWSIAINS